MTDYGKPYDCPNCGWVSGDDPPEAVTYEFDRGQWQVENRPDVNDPDNCYGSRYVERTKGHSDMMTHECPECGEESWNQGWHMKGTHDD